MIIPLPGAYHPHEFALPLYLQNWDAPLDPVPFELIPNINFDKSTVLFNISTSNPKFKKDFIIGDKNFGGIDAHIPVINTSGGLVGQVLKSQGQDNFIELSLDVDQVASILIPQLPQLEREFSIPSDDDPIALIKYNLLDITAKLKTGFQQLFEFIPNLKIKYLLDTGQEFITKVGESIVLPVLDNTKNTLKVTATYFLDNLFSNKTDLTLTPALGIEVLTGKVSVVGKDLINFGPFYKDEFSTPTLPLPVFSNQFPLDGFPTFQENFEIEIVDGRDFGDAPDTFITKLDEGPFYTEGKNQRLGTLWEREPDGQPTKEANGDDNSILGGSPEPINDEDGVIFGDSWVDVLLNIVRSGENKYQIRAWWDKDRNYCFTHPTEPTCPGENELFIDDLISLTPGFYTRRYNLPFNPRDYYSRFRLTWDPLDLDVKPTGQFFSRPDCMPDMTAYCISHGEVEDYAPVPEPRSILGLFTVAGLGVIGLGKRYRKNLNR